jgi:hypothetical protein
MTHKEFIEKYRRQKKSNDLYKIKLDKDGIKEFIKKWKKK